MQSKIHRIELYNFKSYNGRLSIGPFKDFTCIVGPNGSGKSNLMDALSFVLSRNTRTSTLRGKRPTDFVNRKAATKECEVTIVLRRCPVAAENGSTTAAVALANTTETSFSRRVDGEGEVHTLVNGQPVAEKIFFETLEQQHRVSARVNTFLVFQHEVESVARKKARELTELLEDVSGSGELKRSYDEKKRALEEANQALASASTEKRIATQAVNQVRLAKKDAGRFDDLQRRCLEERRDMAVAELFGVERELEKQKEELVAFEKGLAEVQRGVTTEQELREMKRAYTDLHRRYLEGLKRNRKTADELRGKVNAAERVRAALAHLQRKHDALSGELKAMTAADTVRSRELQHLEGQLRKQQQMLRAFEEQCAREDGSAAAAEGALSAETVSEYRCLRREADCETVTLRQQLETVRRQRAAVDAALAQCAAAEETQQQQKAEAAQDRARTEAYIDQLAQRHADLLETQEQLEQQLEDARRELQATQKRTSEREAELAKVEEQLHQLRFLKDSDRQSTRVADALQALRALFPIRGRLIDLCSVPNERYRNAVTAALGRSLDAVIVNSTETAIACVRYLKEQRMPPMTFLPLDSVTGAAVDDRLRTFGGTCKPVVDVVRFDAELAPAIRFALGQTLVCDAMTEARRIAYSHPGGERFKVVTVDGTTLLKNGSVQGGLAAVQSRARRWDEKRYDDLRAARDRLLSDGAGGSEAALARAQIAVRTTESRLTFTRSRVRVVEGEQTAAVARLRACDEEAARLESAAHTVEERKAICARDLAAADADMQRAADAVAKVEARVFADFQKRVNLPHLHQMEDRQAALTRQRAERRQQLQLLVHRLEGAIETERRRAGGQAVADLKETCTRLQREREQCEANLQAEKEGVAAAEKENASVRAEVAKAREHLDQLEGKIRQVTRDSEKTLTRLAYARKGATGLQVACDTLRMRRLTIVRRCQMDETPIPLVPESEVTQRAKRVRTTEESRQRGRDRHGESTGDSVGPSALLFSEPFSLLLSSASGQSSPDAGPRMCVDFTMLSDALRAVASDRSRFAAYKQRTEALVEELVAEMESLAPNLKAATRVVASESRLGTSSTVLEEAREQVRKAQAEFQHVKGLRSARFMEVYDKVAAHVDRVYQELTLGTRAHAVHGSAYLSLEDVEEPYLGGTTYHATPPLKRFMPMELLSGGERTMAALALLFAIHAVSPTPFFVLDEVDAALDAGNVEKLANYLRSNSKNCQFVVVSLKDQLYHLADILLGVMKDKERESSKVLTMDLRGYPY